MCWNCSVLWEHKTIIHEYRISDHKYYSDIINYKEQKLTREQEVTVTNKDEQESFSSRPEQSLEQTWPEGWRQPEYN